MVRKLLAVALLLPALARADVTAYNAAVTADSPVGWWKLNDTSGTTAVGLGSAPHDLTYHGTPTLNQTNTGITGGTSVKFDGSTAQYANYTGDTGDCSGTYASTGQSWTVEGWVNVHDVNGGGLAGGYVADAVINSSGKWGWALFAFPTASAKFGFGIFDNGSSGFYELCQDSVGPTVDTWYYLAGTWNLGTTSCQLYKNASSVATSSSHSGTQGCGQGMNIAARADFPTNSFINGWVQDVAIYYSVLSGTRITAHYNAATAAATHHGGVPYIVRGPDVLPRFWEKNYFAKMIHKGYNTGLFDITAHEPQYMMTGYMPFVIAPDAELDR